MNKWVQFVIGVLSAGAVQYGTLWAASVTDTNALMAGTVLAMGTAAAGLLKQLPKREWSEEERVSKLGKDDA